MQPLTQMGWLNFIHWPAVVLNIAPAKLSLARQQNELILFCHAYWIIWRRLNPNFSFTELLFIEGILRLKRKILHGSCFKDFCVILHGEEAKRGKGFNIEFLYAPRGNFVGVSTFQLGPPGSGTGTPCDCCVKASKARRWWVNPT